MWSYSTLNELNQHMPHNCIFKTGTLKTGYPTTISTLAKRNRFTQPSLKGYLGYGEVGSVTCCTFLLLGRYFIEYACKMQEHQSHILVAKANWRCRQVRTKLMHRDCADECICNTFTVGHDLKSMGLYYTLEIHVEQNIALALVYSITRSKIT